MILSNLKFYIEIFSLLRFHHAHVLCKRQARKHFGIIFLKQLLGQFNYTPENAVANLVNILYLALQSTDLINPKAIFRLSVLYP